MASGDGAASIAFMKAVRKSVSSILAPGCESVAAVAAEAAGRLAKARRVPHFLVPFMTALHDGASM